MRAHHRRLQALCLAFALLTAGLPATASAAPAAPTAAQIAAKRAEAAKAETTMSTMRAQLASSLSSYSRVSAELDRTRRGIAENGAHLKALESTLTAGESLLRDRADNLYRTGRSETLDLLFAATSFDEFLSRIDMLTRMAESDAGLIRTVTLRRAESARVRGVLKAREQHLVELRAKADSQRAGVQAQITRQQTALGSLSADVAALVRRQELAAAPRAPARTSSGGSLPPGRASSGVGLASAVVDGLPGSWTVMASEPRHYRSTGITKDGEASTYGTAENGTGTASGHPLNDRELTCASPNLPFGTHLAVSHGGNRVIVVVTDRGPYTGGRILDLSLRAASILGLDGVGNVHCVVVEP